MTQEQFSESFIKTMDSFANCQELLTKIDDVQKNKLLATNSRIKEHTWKKAPFRVAFCGVFSAGKSSLINELLQCEYKLPTGINPITKIVTRIRYGKELSCFYYYKGTQNKLDSEKTKLIIKGKESVPVGCTEVTLEMPAEILKNNIEFLDTPGFDDESGELEYMSRNAISSADMVVLCCSALQLGKMMERELISELESAAGNFCMAVTRMDCLNTDNDVLDIKRKASWLMQGRGNLAMLPDASGKCFYVTCAGKYRDVSACKQYLQTLLSNTLNKAMIRNSTDMLSMVSLVAEISPLADKVEHEIELSEIKGKLPHQELQETFANGMKRMMTTASIYCPQCGRKMKPEQMVCPVCGRMHQIKVRHMNQETKEKLAKVSQLISKDNSDYDIIWDLEARRLASVVKQVKQLAEVSELPGVTESLRTDLEGLIAQCRNAEFQIAIVGVMKAGKSMLMNALMGVEIASVDINPETAALTKFRSADEFYVKVFFHSASEWKELTESVQNSNSQEFLSWLKKPEMKELSKKWLGHDPMTISCDKISELREQVAHWSSARSGDHLFASEVEVGIKREIFDMPNEVIFVDTPGLHDPVKYRSDITKEYIKKANAVLVAVPTRALTAEGLETITTTLDYVGSKKEKAYIVATQKDINSNEECEAVIKGWVKHLIEAKRYKNEEEVRSHIVVTSGKMSLMLNMVTGLNDEIFENEMDEIDSGKDRTEHFLTSDLDCLESYMKKTLKSKKILRNTRGYDVFSLRENPEHSSVLIDDTGIPALRECIAQNLLSRYKDWKMQDIREEYLRCRKEMLKIARDAKKTNLEMLNSARSGAGELKKKLDESTRSYELAKVKNKEIREAAEQVRMYNLQLIASLNKEEE